MANAKKRQATSVIHHGDLFDVLPTLDAESVDACVTDPPYNLSFMGKSWDSFGGTEDAGFNYWLSGLIDGEGCFTIKAHTRGTHAPQFTLKLRADELGTLEAIIRTLKIGTLSHEDREGNPTVRWTVGDKAGCQRLVDLLDKYPLRAKKWMDYSAWREAVCEWSERPRGNRWHGPTDNARMVALRERLMKGRKYTDVAWSGNQFQDWCRLWALEVYRVLKPGAHMLAMGGTRTFHRMTAGIEDAGFEIRDCLSYLYGQGFPKSLNLGDGLGTALKPGWEPIVLARKPFKGTLAVNVEDFGTGALNIDDCRVGSGGDYVVHSGGSSGSGRYGFNRGPQVSSVLDYRETLGRWPPNVVLDGDAAAMLDEQSGELTSGDLCRVSESRLSAYGFKGDGAEFSANSGGASRFFYIAKPSREERDYGTHRLTAKQRDDSRKVGNPGGDNPRNRGLQPRGNSHPTVKPIELMRWLVRLVTPPNGVVLDPFTGSGTTGMACRYELREFIGIEREVEYVEIAQARIAAVVPLFSTLTDEPEAVDAVDPVGRLDFTGGPRA